MNNQARTFGILFILSLWIILGVVEVIPSTIWFSGSVGMAVGHTLSDASKEVKE